MEGDARGNTVIMQRINSRSPRSLQARNTKNLHLNINDNKGITISDATKAGNRASSITTRPVLVGSSSANAISQQLVTNETTLTGKNFAPLSPATKRNDASIYSLPNAICTSPVYTTRKCRSSSNLDSNTTKTSRGHSLSLSVKTKQLEPVNTTRARSQTVFSTLDTSTPRSSSSSQKDTWVVPSRVFDDETKRRMSQRYFSEDIDMSQTEVYKENAYPNGPLLVVPPNIFLYSEPKLDELLKFDVVINVAKEIVSFKYLISDHREVDYYHIPWTHSSKIAYDLENLTNIMHAAVSGGKKVLVHCQCGVSRSASLIVAYIMRFYNMNLNDAYGHLKHTARDISPNMGLIFQLMEWSDYLQRYKGLGDSSTKQDSLRDDEYEGSGQETNKKMDINIVRAFDIPLLKANSSDNISFSPEGTPQTPSDYFKDPSSSSSSASTSTSTIVDNQSTLKTLELSPNLKQLISTSDDVTTSSKGDIWR